MKGPVGKVLPKKPNTDLKSLLGKKQNMSKPLSGQKLHEYLVKKSLQVIKLAGPKFLIYPNLQALKTCWVISKVVMICSNTKSLPHSLPQLSMDFGSMLHYHYTLLRTWEEKSPSHRKIGLKQKLALQMLMLENCVKWLKYWDLIHVSRNWLFPFLRSISTKNK